MTTKRVPLQGCATSGAQKESVGVDAWHGIVASLVNRRPEMKKSVQKRASYCLPPTTEGIV